MATLKSTAFTAQEAGYAGDTVALQAIDGKALHFEFAFPSTVTAGDNMILGYLPEQPLPELATISSDGGATALTVDIGHGRYYPSSGVLSVQNVDSLVDGYVADDADSTRGLHDDAPTAGVFTRITPENEINAVGQEYKTVLIATAAAETSGEDANLIYTVPVASHPTS